MSVVFVGRTMSDGLFSCDKKLTETAVRLLVIRISSIKTDRPFSVAHISDDVSTAQDAVDGEPIVRVLLAVEHNKTRWPWFNRQLRIVVRFPDDPARNTEYVELFRAPMFTTPDIIEGRVFVAGSSFMAGFRSTLNALLKTRA